VFSSNLPHPRLGLAAVTAAALALVPLAADARTPAKVKAPRSGGYSGKTSGKQDLTISISAKSIQVIVIGFNCGDVKGTTNVSDFPLKKTKKGYAFDIFAHGGVTYSDEKDPDNAVIDIRGRFTRDGKRAAGRLRVKTPRCGNSGYHTFQVKR
jgi:hypothetical protein